MEQTRVTLTVCFAEPFWIGLYERENAEGYQVVKVIFGAEPNIQQIQQSVLRQFPSLIFSRPMVSDEWRCRQQKNPKRIQRAIHCQTRNTGIGTKAQQALQAEREAHKMEYRKMSKEAKAAKQRQRFLQKQQKNGKSAADIEWNGRKEDLS